MRNLMEGEIKWNFKNNPYDRTQWHDDVTDPVTGEVIEDGTPYMSEYANNFEWGIYNAYQFLMNLASTVRRIQIQMELDGRVPGNVGTFADTLDGNTNKINLDTTLTDMTTSVIAGTTVLPVASTTGFVLFSQVTIFDDEHHEDVFITAIGTDTITVQALTHSYKKGAKITRSIVAIDTENAEMGIGDWLTYSVTVEGVI